MTLKRFITAIALLALMLWPVPKPVRAAGRINITFTIAAGTPVQIWTQSSPYLVNELLIQPQPGSSAGVIYVMAGIGNGRTPAHTNSSDLTATLCAATSTAPGCTYSDGTLATPNSAVDISGIFLDGAHTGDTVTVSFDTRD